DESGSKASASRFFVVAAVKLRDPGKLAREIVSVRDRCDFKRSEFRFSEITRGTLPAYYELVDKLEASNAHIAACVVNKELYDAFKDKRPAWQVHAEVITQLLVGCINQRELVSVLLDGISTPVGVSMADTVRHKVNRKFKNTSIVSAACLDSRSCDGLQVADLVAGAIAFERRRLAGESGNENSNKAKVANRLKAALGGVDFTDQRVGRVNIATYRGLAKRKPSNVRPPVRFAHRKLVEPARFWTIYLLARSGPPAHSCAPWPGPPAHS
ncbi:MAG: DUF3800 domain-containing protein, partial [Solirubrobacterales bacterium]|nr:DUF3800 domain-containing protein [Solirubrobacterales bacterium]